MALAVEEDIVSVVGAIQLFSRVPIQRYNGHVQKSESEEISVLLERRFGSLSNVLLLKLSCDWVLVTEDEVNLKRMSR